MSCSDARWGSSLEMAKVMEKVRATAKFGEGEGSVTAGCGDGATGALMFLSCRRSLRMRMANGVIDRKHKHAEQKTNSRDDRQRLCAFPTGLVRPVAASISASSTASRGVLSKSHRSSDSG